MMRYTLVAKAKFFTKEDIVRALGKSINPIYEDKIGQAFEVWYHYPSSKICKMTLLFPADLHVQQPGKLELVMEGCERVHERFLRHELIKLLDGLTRISDTALHSLNVKVYDVQQ